MGPDLERSLRHQLVDEGSVDEPGHRCRSQGRIVGYRTGGEQSAGIEAAVQPLADGKGGRCPLMTDPVEKGLVDIDES
jgi:hypothetical protein